MKTSVLFLFSAASFMPAAAQDVLPFPPTPSASTAGLSMQDSIHKKRVEPERLPKGAPNILMYFDAAPFKFNGTLGTSTIKYVK